MNDKVTKKISSLITIFFISGFSALIYQVVWQRLLFTGFGVDLTSVTIIISVFMAGLGIGAYFGGRIADRFGQNIIVIFCLIEFFIGVFGAFSYFIILNIQNYFISFNIYMMSFGVFIVLLFPTFLMGATLPLLTTYLNRYINNIGDAIGSLYFYNTLGAAFGALATGFIFFNHFTLTQTTLIAACSNFAISILVYRLYGAKDEK